MNAAPFFAYARERYEILLKRRAGQPPPWTDNPILQRYRFCNVFRTDDVVTQWIKKQLLDPLTYSVAEWNLLPVMVAARFINRVSTLEALKDILLEEGWHSRACKAKLYDLRKAGQPIVTGAYMIRTPHGINKIEGLDVVLKPIQRAAKKNGFDQLPKLQEQHAKLMAYPLLGSFMAYEVVTDLSYAFDYDDHYSWANAGPGAARGLSRVFFGEIGHLHQGAKDQPEMCRMMRELLAETGDPENWSAGWPRWDMRTVEHTLCETDKYERVRLGEGEPKQRYEPNHRP